MSACSKAKLPDVDAALAMLLLLLPCILLLGLRLSPASSKTAPMSALSETKLPRVLLLLPGMLLLLLGGVLIVAGPAVTLLLPSSASASRKAKLPDLELFLTKLFSGILLLLLVRTASPATCCMLLLLRRTPPKLPLSCCDVITFLLLCLPVTPLPLLLMRVAAGIKSGSCSCCFSLLLLILPFVTSLILLLLLLLL
jgi:hypothetical protein